MPGEVLKYSGKQKQLTKHFNLVEVACKDGTPLPDNLYENAFEAAENMEIVRTELGNTSIHVISWYRTVAWNKKKKGAKYSQHLKGRAVDFMHDEHTPSVIYVVLDALMNKGIIKQGGLGLYNTFVHYDCRGTKARWDKRTKK
jgi:uncharacterized protein YcbK (DUF882 family)